MLYLVSWTLNKRPNLKTPGFIVDMILNCTLKMYKTLSATFSILGQLKYSDTICWNNIHSVKVGLRQAEAVLGRDN